MGPDGAVEGKPAPVDRLAFLRGNPDTRFWWYRYYYSKYEPLPFALLSDAEVDVLRAWYEDITARNLKGETGPPLISVMQAFLMATNLRRVVQCGHYAGFSTLLLGFILRKMGHTNALFTVDINEKMTEYTRSWVERAGLTGVVKTHVGDSASPDTAKRAEQFLRGAPQAVLIDSSHQYEHTLKELDLWFEKLTPGGFIFLHDVSDFAAQWDSTRKGGVRRALTEWLGRNNAPCLSVNDIAHKDPNSACYADGCGVGIIQKPLAVREGVAKRFAALTSELHERWGEHDQPPFETLTGSLEALILGFRFSSSGARERARISFSPGERVRVELAVHTEGPLDDLICGIIIQGDGRRLFEENTMRSQGKGFSIGQPGTHVVTLEFTWPEVPAGKWPVTLGLGRGSDPDHHHVLCWANRAVLLDSGAGGGDAPRPGASGLCVLGSRLVG